MESMDTNEINFYPYFDKFRPSRKLVEDLDIKRRIKQNIRSRGRNFRKSSSIKPITPATPENTPENSPENSPENTLSKCNHLGPIAPLTQNSVVGPTPVNEGKWRKNPSHLLMGPKKLKLKDNKNNIKTMYHPDKFKELLFWPLPRLSSPPKKTKYTNTNCIENNIPSLPDTRECKEEALRTTVSSCSANLEMKETDIIQFICETPKRSVPKRRRRLDFSAFDLEVDSDAQ